MNILEKAQHIVNGDRAQEYGNANLCFNKIAVMWSAYLGHYLTPHDVTQMMVLLKVCRGSAKREYQEDSILDIAGYCLCAENIEKESL